MSQLTNANETPQTVTTERINDDLHAYCQRQIAAAAQISTDYAQLWATIDSYIKSGGKRLRPKLVLLAYHATAHTNEYDIAPVAAAWELLHASLLMHDDIIDRDDTRHGNLNVAGSYRLYYDDKTDAATADHLALSAALLAGDAALSGCYDMILGSSLPAEQQIVALRRIADTINVGIGGQLLDTEAILKHPDEVQTDTINLYKTAIYSFVNPLLAGAELADAPEADMALLRQYGAAVGIGYQLADDLLGLFGNTAVTGKSNFGDLKEGKRTLLLQESLRALDEQGKATLMSVINGSSDDYDSARRLIEASGAPTVIRERIAALCDEALVAVDQLSWSEADKETLRGLARKNLAREE